MKRVIETNFRIEEMKINPTVGTHIKDALEEGLKIAKQIDGQVILKWNTVDIYIDKTDKLEELLQIWKKYTHTRKVRIITNHEVNQFKKIEIIAIKNVKAKYGQEKGHIGFLAKDEHGRIYHNNFYSYNDDALFNPYSVWVSKTTDDPVFFWNDIMWGLVPPTKRKLIAERFPNEVSYCQKHNSIFWKEETCFLCEWENLLILTHITTA